MNRPLLRTACILACATVALALVLSPAAAEDDIRLRTDAWLVLGPIDIPDPAFDDDADKPLGLKDLIGYEHLNVDNWSPQAGASVDVFGGRVKWKSTKSGTDGLKMARGNQNRIYYGAAWVETSEWTEVKFKVASTQAFEVWVGGESVVKQTGTGKLDDAKSGSVKLRQGKHLLLFKAAATPVGDDDENDWRIDVAIAGGDKPGATWSARADRFLSIADVLDGPSVSGMQVSPDGQWVMLPMSTRTPPEGTRTRWTEIRSVKDGKLRTTLRDTRGGSWQWVPNGTQLSYTTSDDKKTSIRTVDIASGEITTVIDGIKDFSGYRWSPDATFIVYSVRTRAEESKTGVKRYRGAYDKRGNERDFTALYLVDVASGLSRQLTSGKISTRLADIHPSGDAVLVSRTWEDLSKRPYSETELAVINLRDQSVESLVKGPWLGAAQYSPRGDKILVTAGPNAFDGIGRDVPDDVIANDYDTQAFVLDPATGAVDAITKDFDPAVRSAYWPEQKSIYIVATEGEFSTLVRYDIAMRAFSPIKVDGDVIHSNHVPRTSEVAVLTASQANRPARVFTVDLRRGKSSLLMDPGAERFAAVTIGNVDDFEYTANNGTSITGRVHYPPNFDSSKTYPCIVYYYGGTSPVTRSFGGRYPKNLWAAHGYVVYVMQPSGATGFGQEYSARHVNDWGKTTADEIIDGVKAFLAAHPFVDQDRVGCIGASFGGFMTQLLVTKTDIFAAAVSHAGISMIASYWGEGYWGYGYNSVSAAGSFPWNRRDIYVDQSPLFAADKIVTPLLLLHGGSDTNVPPGESEQMYTALKLLGKDVEYLRIAGEDHWILDYKKRIIWSDAIIAWFDKWLKEKPEWWDDMYPPLDQPSENLQSATP